MAQTVKLKRSATPSKVPTTTDLALGELAINTNDGKLYLKKSVSSVESIVEVGPYPASGIPNSTGSAWGTSYSTTGSGTVVALATSPSFTTPTLGVASATSINKVTITAPATGSTLTIADGKTLTSNNSLTLSGTDSTTMTFPSTSATVARTDAGQTFTGNQTITESVGGSGLTITGATQTASYPALNITQTWNDGGGANVSFVGIKANFTTTSSATSSRLMDLQLGGSSIFYVRRTGIAYSSNQFSAADGVGLSSTYCSVKSAGYFQFSSDATYYGTADVFLSRKAAANLQIGAADAAAPVAQTLSVQSVVAGTSNTAGTSWTFKGSAGTGTGAGGSIIFQVAPAGSSGTSQNTFSDALTIASDKSATFAGTVSGGTYNKVTITAPATGSTLTIADGKTLTASNTLTFTGTDASSVAFGTGGTVAYTGGKLSQFSATTSSELAGVISDETGSGALVFATSPTLVTPALGTPSSGTLTNCTGLPVGGISATGTPSATTYLRGDGTWSTVSASGGSVSISTTAPASPSTGALWWESDVGVLYTYTGSVWVEAEQPLNNPVIDLNGGTASTATFDYLLDLGASV